MLQNVLPLRLENSSTDANPCPAAVDPRIRRSPEGTEGTEDTEGTEGRAHFVSFAYPSHILRISFAHPLLTWVSNGNHMVT